MAGSHAMGPVDNGSGLDRSSPPTGFQVPWGNLVGADPPADVAAKRIEGSCTATVVWRAIRGAAGS
jgi:hypothetical protein